MIDEYNYNDEPSGRADTLAMALDKCERLEKQLDIALKCLKEYADENYYLFPTYRNGHERAKQALNKIKELEK